jgi:hypothetical protein
MNAEATVVIKGRNELTAAVTSAERSLKGLLKQGELIGKLFRGGAITGAALAFERLAENAEKAAIAVGNKGTAKALGELNREIDRLKQKGTNVIGTVLGNVYAAFSDDRMMQLNEQIDFLKRMQGRSFVAANYKDIGTGYFTAAEGAAKLLELEQKRAEYQRKFYSGSVPGSRSNGRSVSIAEPPKAGKFDPMAGLDELTVWQREMFDFGTMAAEWADDFSSQVTNKVAESMNVLANETRAAKMVVEEMEQPLSQMTVFAEEAARNMQGIFANWFMEMDGGFKGLLGSFTNMLRQMVAQLLAQQVLNSFFSWGAGLGGWFGSFSKSALGGARAGGGPVMGGSAYLVGERGPELFVPGASGTIIPNGGGGSVQVTNYVTINDDTDLRRSMPAIMAQVTVQSVEQAKASIRGDVKRYGKIR